MADNAAERGGFVCIREIGKRAEAGTINLSARLWRGWRWNRKWDVHIREKALLQIVVRVRWLGIITKRESNIWRISKKNLFLYS